jgi:hypothetical protein
MNSSGKVLIVFLVITAILLISLTAISLFFFQKETERRKLAEATLEKHQIEKHELEKSLEEIKKENFLLQEKNKEADELVNDLTDELELEKGLKEEMKLETAAIKEQLEQMKKEKETFAKSIEEKENLQEKLKKDFTASEQRVKELEAQLKAEIERSQKLGELYEQQQEEVSKLTESQLQKEDKNSGIVNDEEPGNVVDMGIELGEIVVVPEGSKTYEAGPDFLVEESAAVLDSVLDGRILSVDTETEFVIVSLGESDGLSIGSVLSIYRNEDYIGDIKITRLQPKMSAADLIQPLSIRNVRKNDQVKTKQ